MDPVGVLATVAEHAGFLGGTGRYGGDIGTTGDGKGVRSLGICAADHGETTLEGGGEASYS